MSKDLHLVALGNALVDIELQVQEHELEATKLPKGGMSLAAAADQHELLQSFDANRARMSSGGSAANTVIAFRQFGGRAAYKTLLGKDSLGDFFAGEFDELGLHLFADRSSSHPTGTCVVLVTPDGERTMQTSLGVNTNFSREHVNSEVIKRSEWLYIEGYKFTEESGAEAIDEAIFHAKKAGVHVAVTFSDTFIVNVFRDSLHRAVQKADLIFCNEFEAKAYAETDSADEAFKSLTSSIPHVVMTMGSQGSRLRVSGSEYHVPAFETTVLNTNGAGDMYAGAFLYGMTHGYKADASGRLASYASSLVVAQHGARLHSSHTDARDFILGDR
ncbi:MAG: adenosine kinase [Candidatus Kapaibacterium sp.]|jgi:sugar/nucleoside kinase (ribokinase family)